MARAGLQADVTVLVDGLITRFLARTGEIAPKPGALRIVSAACARRVPIAVATSSPQRVATRVLASTGLLPHFGALAFGDEVTHLKPDPAVYLLAAERLGVHPGGCMVLEDSPTGAEAGRRAGATVYAVPEGEWRSRGFTPFVDGVFGSLDEVVTRLGW